MRLRTVLVVCLLASVAAAAVAGLAIAGHDKGNDKKFEHTIGLCGDLPYSDAQAQRSTTSS